ncbi:unnamed protein product [Amoebophrya sp. A120]|nr:unnamed protein product [Amoebophrya sp. A120]|eukprot:GSA120T00010580001.1
MPPAGPGSMELSAQCRDETNITKEEAGSGGPRRSGVKESARRWLLGSCPAAAPQGPAAGAFLCQSAPSAGGVVFRSYRFFQPGAPFRPARWLIECSTSPGVRRASFTVSALVPEQWRRPLCDWVSRPLMPRTDPYLHAQGPKIPGGHSAR